MNKQKYYISRLAPGYFYQLLPFGSPSIGAQCRQIVCHQTPTTSMTWMLNRANIFTLLV